MLQIPATNQKENTTMKKITIKLFLLIFLIFSITEVSAEENFCANPQKSIQTLLRNLHSSQWDRKKAASCIQGNEKLALQLKQVLDAKGIYVNYDNISPDPSYLNERGEAKALIDLRIPEIIFEKEGDEWQLSQESKKSVQRLYNETFSSHVSSLLDLLPAFFFENFLGLQVWQYFLFVVMLFISWGAGRFVNYLISSQVVKYFRFQNFQLNQELLLTLRLPIVWLTISALFLAWIPDLQLSIRPSQFLYFITRLILSFSAVLLCSRFVDFLSDVFLNKAGETESKLDDQLVPLVKRATKTMICLFCSHKYIHTNYQKLDFLKILCNHSTI